MSTKPSEFKSLEDVRASIDAVDREIIRLLSKRSDFVRAAAAFKKNETDVQAPERFKSMLLKRQQWAQEENLDPDMVEKLYSDLVNYFISQEMLEWKKSGGNK